jgi:hypothetical protein
MSRLSWINVLDSGKELVAIAYRYIRVRLRISAWLPGAQCVGCQQTRVDFPH